jgi:hypothetical protein
MPEVGFWHERDAGFRGRQPLASLKGDIAVRRETRESESGLN